jgi:molybdenum cofactor biosynthesis enzyme MoaA
MRCPHCNRIRLSQRYECWGCRLNEQTYLHRRITADDPRYDSNGEYVGRAVPDSIEAWLDSKEGRRWIYG